jgi:hypothetical protein
MQPAEVEAPGHLSLTAGIQLMEPPAGGGFDAPGSSAFTFHRPATGEKRLQHAAAFFHLFLSEDKRILAYTRRSQKLIPLITNTPLQASELLKKYKSQPFLEKRMYTQKTVLEVAPVFLKKEGIDNLPILPQGMNTKKPTWNNFRYFYRNVHFAQIIRDGVCIQAVVQGLSELHKQINRLLEIPESVYRYLRDDWSQFKTT